MQITQERPGDAAAIRTITDAAFRGKPYSSQTEAKIIDALRERGALTLSLVAILDGEIVGHAAFSPVTINGELDDWYGLGPVSVRPDKQRNGIGQTLIREGLERLKTMQAKGCVVEGDPGYYSRFGFANDPEMRYGDIPQMYFQRLTFIEPSPKGEVMFHPGFEAT